MEKGVPVRVITRTLKVLQTLNRGSALTMMEISKACNLAYPTTCRIVQSLVHEGFLETEPQRKVYRPTAICQTLSYGFQDENRLASLIRPAMIKITKKIGWPVCILTRVGDSMVIRDSTHSLTTMVFSQYHPGFAIPIWGSASGIIHLAFCPEDERNFVLKMIDVQKQNDIDTSIIDERFINNSSKYIVNALADVRHKGYATYARNKYALDKGKTSSVAIPLFIDGNFVAALAVVFFSSALRPDQAADKYQAELAEIQKTVSLITPTKF